MSSKKIYSCLPNVSVQELRLSQDNLNTKRMLSLMVARPGQAGRMPLYLHTVMRVLRELRIRQQLQGGGFNYQEFKNAMRDERLTTEQSLPLQQRLDTLESFMVEQDTNARRPTNKARKSIEAHGSIDWKPVVSSSALLFWPN
jgi:hypothetical protein